MGSKVEIANETTQHVDAASVTPMKRHQLEGMTEDQILEIGVKLASCTSWLSGISIIGLVCAAVRYENTIAQYKHLLSFLVIVLFLSFICGALMLLVWALFRPSPKIKSVVRRLTLGSIIWAVVGVGIAICISITALNRNHALSDSVTFSST